MDISAGLMPKRWPYNAPYYHRAWFMFPPPTNFKLFSCWNVKVKGCKTINNIMTWRDTSRIVFQNGFHPPASFFLSLTPGSLLRNHEWSVNMWNSTQFSICNLHDTRRINQKWLQDFILIEQINWLKISSLHSDWWALRGYDWRLLAGMVLPAFWMLCW